jgi:mRNA interferase MazF
MNHGEVWLADLGDPVNPEPGLRRPVLVVSETRFNDLTGLAIICPITTTHRPYVTRIEIEPGISGLRETSYIQVEQIRTISGLRRIHLLGEAGPVVLGQVEQTLRRLLRLP